MSQEVKSGGYENIIILNSHLPLSTFLVQPPVPTAMPLPSAHQLGSSPSCQIQQQSEGFLHAGCSSAFCGLWAQQGPVGPL